jgi:acyl-coenzyme A synthetase/AMP-(fatty) acid ligase
VIYDRLVDEIRLIHLPFIVGGADTPSLVGGMHIEHEEEMIRFCKERLARYKVPKKIHFVKELPKSPQGKILRRELKKQ